ncbi:hypothetical protein ACUXEW_001557 [Staphylococcus hominis]
MANFLAIPSIIGVSTIPGANAFTVISLSAKSRAAT